MEIRNIEDLDFGHITTEQAGELGLNTIFQERDGTYNWIYCMNMLQDRSMLRIVLKIFACTLLPIMIIAVAVGSDGRFNWWAFGVTAIVFVAVIIIIVLSFAFVNLIYKGKYMMVYQMNHHELIFSQTSDQAQITSMLSATYGAVSSAAGDVGGVIAGAGLALRPNSHVAQFSKVRAVKGVRKDNLIWVHSFFQHLMVYVPEDSYDFVWRYITERCTNARIREG